MSLKNLILRIHNLADIHPSLNYFGFGEEYDLNSNKMEYPYLWVSEEPHTMLYSENNAYNQIEYNLTLRVGDLFNTQGKSNEIDLINDTAWILSDVVAIIANNTNSDFGDYKIEGDLTIVPFYRNESADVTGHEVTLSFKTLFKPCISPI